MIHDTDEIIFNTDAEHPGLRRVVLLTLIGGFIGSYLLFRFYYGRLPEGEPDFAGIASCFLSVVTTLALAGLVEFWLKRSWPSGHQIRLSTTYLMRSYYELPKITLPFTDPIMATYWKLSLKGYARGGRERRVPSSWYCIGAQFNQGKNRINCHVFVPARELSSWQNIPEIDPLDVYDSQFRSRKGQPKRPELDSKILAGKDGHLWLAERNRWDDSLELTRPDFHRLYLAMEAHIIKKK